MTKSEQKKHHEEEHEEEYETDSEDLCDSETDDDEMDKIKEMLLNDTDFMNKIMECMKTSEPTEKSEK